MTDRAETRGSCVLVLSFPLRTQCLGASIALGTGTCRRDSPAPESLPRKHTQLPSPDSRVAASVPWPPANSFPGRWVEAEMKAWEIRSADPGCCRTGEMMQFGV